MEVSELQDRLAELEQKKNKIKAQEKRLKAQLAGEKRKKENHAKMILGGAVFGLLKDQLPADRKDLDLYGRALKAVLAADSELAQKVTEEYEKLRTAAEEPVPPVTENSKFRERNLEEI